MLMLNRVNRSGRSYRLREVFGEPAKTLVAFGDKSVTVNASIHEMNVGWAKWVTGAYIQDAFPFLSADEREFLMTGLTPAEWNAMFPE